jgi:hypothetical protein
VPENWNPDQIRQFQAYWDSLNAGDTAERRHAKFVPGGVAKTFVPVREPAMKDAFDEWLARIVCYVFSVPPSAFTGQVNRATADTAQDVALSEGMAPLQLWVKHLLDRVIAEDFASPDLEFAWDQDKDTDPAQTASIASDYVRSGIKSINEIRAELGLPPVKGGEVPKIQTGQGLMPLTQAGASPASGSVSAAKAFAKAGFDPDQPRDDHGMWTSEGGDGETSGNDTSSNEEYGDDTSDAPSSDNTNDVTVETPETDGTSKPIQVADSGQIMSDATPEQVAQTDERDREEMDPSGPTAPVRRALYTAARAKLQAIDPGNAAIPSLTGPNWVPTNGDVKNMQDTLDRAIESSAADAATHGYEDHQDDFPDVHSDIELQLRAQQIMKNNPPQQAINDRVFFYERSTNTLVIVNTVQPEQSTIYKPSDREAYVQRELKRRR